tara:strand:+ start:3548 stop:4129 length:582 start_codon:yes stop_codon:yes gene_type:complete
MGFNLNIADDFIPEYPAFRRFLDGCDYKGMVNPADGVFYPGVTDDIPRYVSKCVKIAITKAAGFEVDIKCQFLRLSVDGVKAPHQAHNDKLMSEYLCIHYLNRPEDCQGGTSFVRHIETGMDGQPENSAEFEAWERDHSIPDAWEVLSMCEMKENRAFIYPAEAMHRAEPVGGFGKGAEDGRLVMVTFFGKAE